MIPATVTRAADLVRRPPVVVLLVTLVNLAPLVDALAGPGWYIAGPMVIGAAASGYALGALAGPRLAVVGVLLSVALLTAANQLDHDLYHWLDDTVFFAVVVGGPALAGAAVVVRARQVQELRSFRADLAAQRSAQLETARLEERGRVHDQVQRQIAQRLGAIAMRAEGAQRARSGADTALVEVEGAARAALDDLRDALGSLRGADQVPAAAAEDVDGRWDADDVAVGPRPRVRWADLALAAGCGVALGLETLLVDRTEGPRWANCLAALVVALPLAWRRARPLLATAVFATLAAAMSVWLTPLSLLVTPLAPAIITAYAIGAWARGRWWLPGLLLHWSSLVAVAWASDDLGGDLAGALPVATFSVAGLAAGRITAGWQARVHRIAAAIDALERGRGADVRRAVAREREAMASALHDSVAHALTVVCVQAGAARRTADADAADRALRTIASTAQTSLGELRIGLGRLDDPHGPLDRAGISALARAVGVDATAQLPGDLELRGAGAALVYRVLREALVNAARHAPGSRVSVAVDLIGDSVRVRVVDDGATSAAFTAGTGGGLSGLATEVQAAGGRMTWGRTPPGFLVEALVPAATSAALLSEEALR